MGKKFNKNLRHISGVLLLDKPLHLTSNAALQTVKRLYQAAKAGHTGSLDPLASGMLPICFGDATKFAQFLLEEDKSYHVIGKLGVTTTTDDAEGEVIETKPCSDVTLAQIEKVLPQFQGEIDQLPSMYSAIKHRGQPLYKLARQGITVERKSRKVKIYSLKLLRFAAGVGEMEFIVHCSKGTYIRTLISDIGRALGCGAHVMALRRLTVGGFHEKNMVAMGELERLAQQQDYAQLDGLLLPLENMLANLSVVTLTDTMIFYVKQGNPVMVPQAPVFGYVRLKNKSGQFIGVGEMLEDGKVAPRRLLHR
jgi:tRNA pseudouridine55 synthase